MSPLTLHDDEDRGWLSPPPTNIMCRAPVFFFCGLLSWGPGSGFSMIFQSSTTAISQPWHPAVTVTEWQDATFDCHVLYSTEPFSSWGCHQASTSTGIAALLVCVCVYVWAAHKHSLCFFIHVCRQYKQHGCISHSSAGSVATLKVFRFSWGN